MAARNSTKGGEATLPDNVVEDLQLALRSLQTVRCVVLIAVLVLERQNADYDLDVAMALKRAAVMPITQEIERISRLVTGQPA